MVDGQRNSATQNASGSSELVPELELDVDPDDLDAAFSSPEGLPGLIDKATHYLKSEGFEPRSTNWGLEFHLPSGRSSRAVQIQEERLHEIMDIPLAGWRSLENCDGICHQSDGVIEVAMRSDGPSSMIIRRLARMSGQQISMGEEVNMSIRIPDPRSSITIHLGNGSRVAGILLGWGRYSRGGRQLTLRLEGVKFANTGEADDIVESVADSLTLQTGLQWGHPLSPRRLESRTSTESRRLRNVPPQALTFPAGKYPRAPVALYRMGKDRRSSPLLRYWAYYQVLEFFFPVHSRDRILGRLSKAVRSPAFDPFNDQDIVELLAAVDGDTARLSEQEQLKLTLESIVAEDELISILGEMGFEHVLRQKSGGLSAKTVNLKSDSSLVVQLSARIYDIRCRIVHSKSVNGQGVEAGLLPGTDDEELARVELPILEFLAEQALGSAASRLDLRPYSKGADQIERS